MIKHMHYEKNLTVLRKFLAERKSSELNSETVVDCIKNFITHSVTLSGLIQSFVREVCIQYIFREAVKRHAI